jgi:DNA-binding response OmpR family regulator
MTAQPPVALVVEDDEAIRALYVAAFRLRGFLVDEAEFAHVAIDRLSERAYDVLVVDLMLPIESGVYVVDKVRTLPPPRPEIIIITGADSSAVKAIDRSLVRAILFKPINVKALIAYATEVVEEKRAAR